MKRILSAALVLICTLGFAACGSNTNNPATDSDFPPALIGSAASDSNLPPLPTAAASDSDLPPAPTEPAPDTELPITINVMNGSTGFGMAKLISDAAAHRAALNYSISVESDASVVTAALISGSVDIAVIPTNAAANVYNKTEGGVLAAAEVVRGNLYLLQNTETENITFVSDLEGKTVYAPAQNPSFIFNYIALENGLDLTADNSFAEPAALRDALTGGLADLAVLPEPMVTIAMAGNENISIALDLSEVWRNAAGGDIVLGCVAVRSAFAEEHPAELAAFLADYAESVRFLEDDPAAGAQLIADTGIFGQATVAEKAIPRCGLCFVTGERMKAELGAYLEALYSVAPAAVGGALPAEDFYYLG